MLISFEHSFIFLKTFKTASTSTDVYFEQYCCDNIIEERKRNETITEKGIIGERMFKKTHNESDLTYFNHQTAKKIKRNIGDTIFNSYFKFCNVRNPFDMLVSNYLFYDIYNNISFIDFIKNENYLNKIIKRDSKIYTIKGDFILDDFIKYESIEEDISRISNKLNLPMSNRSLGVYVKSKKRLTDDYMSFYNEETIEIVKNSFKKYIDYFGY